PAPNGSTFQALPAYVEDRNGNRIVVTDSGNGAFTMTDTAGRASIVSSGFGSSGNTVTVSGLTNPYTVTWGTATSSFSPNAAYVVNDGRCRGFSGDAETQNVITAIELPNGQSYQFYYDSGTSGNSGLLNEIVYPSGGWVKYTWGYPPTYNEFATFADTGGLAGGCQFVYDQFVLLSRSVSFNGGTQPALVQTFAYTTAWTGGSWTTKTTAVTTQDMTRPGDPEFTTTYTYAPYTVPGPPDEWSYSGSQVPLEQTVVYQDWS